MAPASLSRLGISKVVTFTSTYDHRIIQGAESGAFLARVEELLLGQHGFYEGVFADLVHSIPGRSLGGRQESGALRRRPQRGDLQAGPRPGADQRLPRPRTPARRHRSPAHAPDREPSGAGARDAWVDDLGPRPRVLDGRPQGRRSHAAAPDHRGDAPRVLRQDRHRVPLHLQPDREVLDSRAHRGRHLGASAAAGAAHRAAREAHRGRGVRALPGNEVPGPAPLLGGRLRHDDPPPRPPRGTRGEPRDRRGRDRDVPPRPAQHPGQRRRQRRRAHLLGVRGRRPSRLSGGRGRRQVPPGRAHDAPVGDRAADHRAGRVESVAPGGRRSGRGGRRARQAGAAGGARARSLETRAAGAAPRRCGVRGPGHHRRDPEPRAAAGLPDGRHDSRRRQQPDRLHDAAVQGPLVRLLHGRRQDQPGSRSSTSTPTIPRPPTACSRSRSTTGRSSSRTSSST